MKICNIETIDIHSNHLIMHSKTSHEKLKLTDGLRARIEQLINVGALSLDKINFTVDVV